MSPAYRDAGLQVLCMACVVLGTCLSEIANRCDGGGLSLLSPLLCLHECLRHLLLLLFCLGGRGRSALLDAAQLLKRGCGLLLDTDEDLFFLPGLGSLLLDRSTCRRLLLLGVSEGFHHRELCAVLLGDGLLLGLATPYQGVMECGPCRLLGGGRHLHGERERLAQLRISRLNSTGPGCLGYRQLIRDRLPLAGCNLSCSGSLVVCIPPIA
mmetsp:Transcript_23347/g.59530  ORF Transcript_23347/g.59530 Transcript_23347/m.59530 type:complete len:211 (+) Transcript_23347:226-858(+)